MFSWNSLNEVNTPPPIFRGQSDISKKKLKHFFDLTIVVLLEESKASVASV